MDRSDRKRRPPVERFSGDQHLFDLPAAAQALRKEGEPARGGHRQITLFHEGGLTIMLLDFEAHGGLADHSADGTVAVQTLAGSVEVVAERITHRIPAGSLLLLEPGIVHDLEAHVSSQVLLTVHRRQD